MLFDCIVHFISWTFLLHVEWYHDFLVMPKYLYLAQVDNIYNISTNMQPLNCTSCLSEPDYNNYKYGSVGPLRIHFYRI